MIHRLILVVSFFLFAADVGLADEPTAHPALLRFVGVWRIDPVPMQPEQPSLFSHEVISQELKGRYLIGRDLNHDSQVKSMWFATYDEGQKKYAWTFFNSNGLLGGTWSGTWDEASHTHVSHATDLPVGWTGQGTNRFATKDRVETHAWIKDDSGKQVFELTFTKTRQPEEKREKMLAEWSADPKPLPDLSPQLKLLDRLAGTWDVVSDSKKAEWTPADTSAKSKVIRSWVLNRQFLQDQSMSEDGTESRSLFTYDPKRNEYRSWWFNSEGHTAESTGQANTEGSAIHWKSKLPGGQDSIGSVQITDADHHTWTTKITDASGKVFFDCSWQCSRAN